MRNEPPKPEYRELLLGCGSRRDKVIKTPGHDTWSNLTTLDLNPECKPDKVWDLSKPIDVLFDPNYFDEIHAYEVLEHLSPQGDHEAFFRQFADYWRVLKPGGLFCATVPSWDSLWAWGDPSHKRIINEGTLAFLSHDQYEKQLGKTPMSDFRKLLGTTNFEGIWMEHKDQMFAFVLKAIKPA